MEFFIELDNFYKELLNILKIVQF